MLVVLFFVSSIHFLHGFGFPSSRSFVHNYFSTTAKNGKVCHPQLNKLSMTISDSYSAPIMSAEEMRRSGLGTVSVGNFKIWFIRFYSES